MLDHATVERAPDVFVARPTDDDASVYRAIYARTADPEASIPGGELVDAVRAQLRAAGAQAPCSVSEAIHGAAEWSNECGRRFRVTAENADPEARRLLMRRAVLAWAPMGLAAGAWLQWLTSSGSGDAPVNLQALALYAGDVGVGHSGTARHDAYLDLLRQLRVPEHTAPLARLAGNVRVADTAFRLPAMMLLMSRRPDDFLPELVGADLCLRAIGLAPPLVLATEHLRADWRALDYGVANDGGAADGCTRADRAASPLESCRAIAETLLDPGVPNGAGSDVTARLFGGFAWTLAELRRHATSLHEELCASLDPTYDMVELIRLRSREGSVYHRDVVLEGRPLAAWLKDCPEDPRPFLAVLARSGLIVPGSAETSPLVRDLVAENGPMFRVFSPEDLLIIRRWIDSLELGAAELAAASSSVPAPARPQPAAPGPARRLADLLAASAAAEDDAAPRDLRDAYHRLMTREGTPAVRRWCVNYIEQWLARARHGLNEPGAIPLPVEWKSEGLRPWLLLQHERHADEFDEIAAAALPTREAVVDDAVQTAPLTLIDGSWLQGFTDYELASSDIGHSLFAIYWDELGNGTAELNHPLIYRHVLQDMGVDLPPTASREFAQWSGLRDASFELPVYWLSIGRFPRTYMPEVLGLNVAMELSGVGGAYRRASIALRRHGFSTRFVDIHNTIDNVATGHSAWATDAVDTLMAGLPDSLGPGGRVHTWERVRAGFRSLTPPDGLRARRAGRRVRAAGRR